MAEDHVMRNEKKVHVIDSKVLESSLIKVDQQKEIIRMLTMYWVTMRKTVSAYPVVFDNDGGQWILDFKVQDYIHVFSSVQE